MTATPIPAGVLTADDEAIGTTGRWYSLRLNGEAICTISAEQRARLLAGPPRPDGVPDDAVPVTMWVGPDQGDASAQMWLGDGTLTDFLADVVWFREVGVPVPPYQPAPDPADSPTETCGYVPPMSEGYACELASGHDGRHRCLPVAAPPVAEWDAEPVETHAGPPDPPEAPVWFSAEAAYGWGSGWGSGWSDGWSAGIEAASRPDPGTITVNLPRWAAERYASDDDDDLDHSAVSSACRAALVAAGRPQEPTEGEQR